MAQSYIPPFPNSNASADTPYTQVFEKARNQKKSGGAPEPILANANTPPNPRHREPDSPRVPASPLHQSYLPGGKSPLHQQGSSGSGSRGNGSGSSRSGSSHKPVNPNYQSHPSPKPSGTRNGGNGRSHEGQIGSSTPGRQIGYGTPGRHTPNRTHQRPAEQYDLVPPFPSDGKETNYTEVFSRIRNESSNPPSMVPYTPQRDQSPKLKQSYIPPFPNSNASADTPYTEVFQKARNQRKSGGAVPEPVLANPKTPPNPRHREPDSPRVTASPLHQSYLPGGKSPLHQQGSSGSGSRGSGSSRSGSSHKPVNLNYQSHPSPKPSGTRNGGNGRSHEGQIGYGTPGRHTPNRTHQRPVEQNDLVPPFPSYGKETNYTEVFYRIRNESSNPPSMVPYTPQRDQSPKLKRCSCFGL